MPISELRSGRSVVAMRHSNLIPVVRVHR